MNRVEFHEGIAGWPAMPVALQQAFQSWDSLMEWLPVGICVCNHNGLLVQFNRRAAEMWGDAPELGNALTNVATGEVLRTGEPCHNYEINLSRADGSRMVVCTNIEPVRDADDHIIGAVTCLQDVTEQKLAEEALRNRERWYRELLEALPAAIYTTDKDGKITFYNQAAAMLAGQHPQLGQDQWCVTWRLYKPDGSPLPHDECPMAIALKENRPVRGAEAIVERPDGTRIPMTPYPTPLRDDAGRLVGAVNMLVDTSERKKAESQQKALIDELNHRVKNTLATVQALAAQTIRGANIPESMRNEFEARLLALSRTHDHLTRTQWASAGLDVILAETLLPYADGRGERIRLDGERVELPPKAALVLAMIFHELATNAAKYGALSTKDGCVDVLWAQPSDDRLTIHWREKGGPTVSEPKQTGFGLRLLTRGISDELGGEAQLEFASSGVRCRIEVPLSPADAA
ncbi:MAG TPA: HWE histidine kinase domain-containing protein [Rhizomicrobium sp.]|nr:HWE histidine kinase domain-containing protein [Rhizomicrobium sp.]